MANNKLYGYTPKTSNEKDGNRLDRLNPSEFRKGMDYELVSMGCYRLAESTIEEREEATEKVIKNLQEYGGYYSALISYETEYRNIAEGQSKLSFKAYLKEMEDYHMIEVDKTYSNDKMTEPKYKKEDHTIPFKTDKMGSFKLKALKEAIKKEVKKQKLNEWPWSKGCWIECVECDLGTKKWCKPCKRSKCCGTKNKAADNSKKQGKGGKSSCVADNKKAKEAYLNKLYPTRKRTLSENKDDDFDEKEPTKAQIKGIDKSIGDTKEALALAQKKVKELAPDIKKLAKETNDKIKKNPAGKADYLKVYQSDPDVKAFIKLRKMLKNADLL
tara:strand:- start:712 stop:1698 length:987 start_codon:yes stop_codon:yes gene_type:complete